MKEEIKLSRADAEEIIDILDSIGEIMGDTEDMARLLRDKLAGRVE